MSPTSHPKEYLDPIYWNPQCSNFELIDWERWEAQNPRASIPQVFDPPQRSAYSGLKFAPLSWWSRSWYFQPLPCIINSCCGPKGEKELISAGGIGEDTPPIFQKLLGSNANSDLVPEPFRNKLLWTENNIAAETLISFNRWAWRSQTEEGRVIGLGNISTDWTNDPNCLGVSLSFYLATRFISIQQSPDGKWIILGTFSDPTETGEVTYMHMYVVQEGDTFQNWKGETMDYVKPGDIIRLTWDTTNPYECRPDKLSYQYFPRIVATINDEGQVVKHKENYQELLKRATNSPGLCCETCCYSCMCCSSAEERFDFQTSNISDSQIFESAGAPPASAMLDRL